MTVAACAGEGAVRIESRPRPAPGPGEMLLRLRCAGLCGTDLFKLGNGTAAAGAVLGHEIVGTVAALGEGVRGFAPGDRVAVPHHVACGECALCRRGNEPLCPAFAREPAGAGRLLRMGAGARARRPRDRLRPPPSPRGRGRRLPGAGRLRAARHPPRAPGRDRPRGTGARLRRDPRRRQHGAAPSAGAEGGPPGPAGRRLRSPGGAPARSPGGWGPTRRRRRARRPGTRWRSSRQAWAPTPSSTRSAAPGRWRRRWRSPAPAAPWCSSPMPEPGRRPGSTSTPSSRPSAGCSPATSSSLADQREVYRLLVSRRLDPSPLVTHRLPLSRFQEAVDLARERRALKVLLVPDDRGRRLDEPLPPALLARSDRSLASGRSPRPPRS